MSRFLRPVTYAQKCRSTGDPTARAARNPTSRRRVELGPVPQKPQPSQMVWNWQSRSDGRGAVTVPEQPAVLAGLCLGPAVPIVK